MKFRFLVPLVLLFLLNCAKKNTTPQPLLNYVPENASVIIKIKDHDIFKKTLKNNAFLSALKSSKQYENLLQKISYLTYVHPKSESILAFTQVNSNTFEFTYVTDNVSDLFQFDSIANKSVETIEFANSTFEKYEVANTIFYGLKSGNKIIISSSKLVLQKLDADRRPIQSEILQKLYATTNDIKSASILVNLDNSNSLLASLLNNKSTVAISGFSDWVSLDFDASSENINLSGISIANDSIWSYIDLFANTKPATNHIASFAPASAEAILSYTFNDYQIFAKNRELSIGLVSPVSPLLNTVEEIGIIYINDQKAAILNTHGAEAIAEYLKGEKKGSIEFQGNEILRLSKSDFLENRFAPLLENFKTNFCTTVDNAFIFSENQEVLKTIISNYKDGNTFEKSSIFMNLKEQISKESSILFMAGSKKIDHIIKDEFSADFAKDIKAVDLSNYAYAAQSISDKNFYHTNIVIQQIENIANSNSHSLAPIFSTSLPNEIATDPQFVTNHLNGKKEIVVQDQKNVLYLISDVGKILWKKQLNSLIQGKIHQVDIFKNNRLQLAFTTNNQLMVLDRKGKEVKQFSKTYEGGNLNPLAVFDYDKKKNYRFVVTQNDNSYMYDSKATIVKGFKFTKAEQAIIAAPKHLVIANKDYLVFKLKDGSLKLLNRIGDVRTKVNEKIDFSENEVFLYKNKFTLTDKKGVLHEIDDTGKITKTNLKLSNDHGMTSTERTLVTMNDNILTIKGKKIELDLGVYTAPEIFFLYKKLYISVTDLQNEKVYLFDSQGKSIKNFPVRGSSTIDLGDIEKNKTLELLVKESSKTIVVYQI